MFLVLGAAELAWGVATMLRSSFPLRSLALVGAILGLVAWASALVLGEAVGVTVDTLPPLALASASLLDIVVAIAMTASLRRSPDGTPAPAAEPAAGWTVLGITVGAVAVVGLALPAIGQTQAGIAALDGPHASHSGVTLPGVAEHDGH
ncbi:hypothetical protein [Naasia aerilata]|uniref:Uncharacterized protein n=1 Tax=Naasia aerilata TaxID=1162966 RepID=A0ABM8GAT0_9MICO|nr:hypothetical protein [Naasia aerilata]BDZ45329.1 hypothetical protein GCM10025866_12380 [Naasia aerilata]